MADPYAPRTDAEIAREIAGTWALHDPCVEVARIEVSAVHRLADQIAAALAEARAEGAATWRATCRNCDYSLIGCLLAQKAGQIACCPECRHDCPDRGVTAAAPVPPAPERTTP